MGLSHLSRRLHRIFFSLVLASAGLPLGAAAQDTVPARPSLAQMECALGTDSKLDKTFHTLIGNPSETALTLPGMIVGIEKTPAAIVRNGADTQKILPQPPGFDKPGSADRFLARHLRHDRSLFISHVVSFSEPATPKVLYSLYDADASAAEGKGSQWTDCKNMPVPAGTSSTPYADGWKAVKVVRDQLRTDLAEGNYTHVVLISMGWITEQHKAVGNFNSIVGNLKKQVPDGTSFKPYIVGVTWPSTWWGVEAPASLFNKADDADELGAGWLGALLRDAVVPGSSASGVKVIAIGHSFGSRAMSHAVCRGSLLVAPPDLAAPAPADGAVQWLINLEGAFSMNRFRKGGAGLYTGVDLDYAPRCTVAQKVIFTTSIHDNASVILKPLKMFNASLAQHTFVKAQQRDGFGNDGIPIPWLYSTVDKNGGITRSDCGLSAEPSTFYYLDASTVMNQTQSRFSNAHSDIYRKEIANMLWNLMNGTTVKSCPATSPAVVSAAR